MAGHKVKIEIDGVTRDASDFPAADRYFRDAWAFADGVIEIDMAKARPVHRDWLREEREGEFKKLDIAWMRAIAIGDEAEANAVEAMRVKLRDVPADARIEAAASPDELKALTLEVLTR